MVIFAILMLLASFSMIKNQQTNLQVINPERRKNNVWPLMIFGILIGVVTGLLGAGGGFLIIPTLVIFLRLPMKTAVGTSLLIIAINSLFGFLFSLKQFEYNWILLLSFTALAIIGIFTGSTLAEKIPAAKLKKGFGWFILIMGIYIIIKEIFFSGSGTH